MREAEERGRQRATQPATFFGRVAKRGSDYVLGSGEGRKKKSSGLTGFLGGLAKNAGESTGFYGARKKRASYSGYDMWNAGGITGGLEWDDPFVEAGPRSRRRRRKGRRR
jgi:hypothetical protein